MSRSKTGYQVKYKLLHIKSKTLEYYMPSLDVVPHILTPGY
jgi:hypothetical protein